MRDKRCSLEILTEKALENIALSAEEIRYLLGIREEEQIALLKNGACRIRLIKAGHQVFMLDKNNHAPAKGLAHNYFCFDLLKATKRQLDEFFNRVEVIIPATENLTALAQMGKLAKRYEKVFCFDMAAYKISSNKIISNRLFERLGLPKPLSWPKANFPVLCKPAKSSGSRGVKVFLTAQEFKAALGADDILDKDIVVEEFLEGPSYSIEVIAVKGKGTALEVTLLHFDELFDCNRVVCPAGIGMAGTSLLREMVLQLAEALQLTGIMDLEVIHTAGEYKILEIDARLPSQTPTVVYHASGVNLVHCLLEAFLYGKIPRQEEHQKKKAVIYEHLYCCNGKIAFPGEHVMAVSRDLCLQHDFFGADEAITNYLSRKKKEPWVATVIVTADNIEEAWRKREAMLENIVKYGI